MNHNLDLDTALGTALGTSPTHDITHLLKAKPFLKWAGGKGSIAKILISKFPQDIKNYYEPFVGGGAIFFKIANKPIKAYLSDVNADLILAYQVIKKDPLRLIRELKKYEKKHSKQYYYTIRKRHGIEDPIKSTARLIYLNKTCFNGLYRVNKGGYFNVPMGDYKKPNICDEQNINEVSKALNKVKIRVCDFWNLKPVADSFIYLDPPYHDCFSTYQAQGFTEDHHTRLAQKVRKWSDTSKIMVSNSDTKFIRGLYKGFNIYNIKSMRLINCKADGRKKNKELIITNYGCGAGCGDSAGYR